MANRARHTTVATKPTQSALPDYIDMSPRELTKVEFGRRLQALMLQKGWSQADLSRQSKLGRDAISTYIRGVSFPEPKNLQKLAKALGVESETLLPNSTIGAMQNDAAPMLEIKQAHGRPNDVWIRVNRIVSFDTAAKIMAMLKEEA
jgi:transcriptional regulator with XRE-family HTH domain